MRQPSSHHTASMPLAALALATAAGAMAQMPSHWPDAMMHHGFETIASGPHTDADAARFLAQATFGTTLEEIARIRTLGYTAWLDAQFQATPSTHAPYLDWVGDLPEEPVGNNHVTDDTRMEIWTINAVGTPDPSRGQIIPADALRQRVAFALSEIFVVSNSNGTLAYQPWALASWYDMLAANAFGNYRDLLEDVTRHPAMGIFLSHIQNQKADLDRNIRPDENYAREVLQLFSIGLVQLNPDGTPILSNGQPVPTYDQATVRGFAAVLTGWNWNTTGCGEGSYTCCTEDTYFWCGPGTYDDPPWRLPMQPIEAFHDNVSTKQLLVYPGVTLPSGMLAPGGDAQAELSAALDNIFNHPNVGPFIAHRLIQRLVTSNPAPTYVQRVAAAFADNGSGVRGDLKATLRAVLLDPEARFGQWRQPDRFGKLREPLVKTTHLWRAMDARSTGGRVNSLSPYPPIESWYGQGPLRSPSVFNFFRPDFRQHGEINALGLASPEFQILSDTMVVMTPNHVFGLVFCDYIDSDRCWASDHPATMQIDTTRDAGLAASDPEALIDLYDLLFLSGQMSPYMHDVLRTRLQSLDADQYGSDLGRVRVQHALYLILHSPEYTIQK